MSKARSALTYANVMATIAVFLALGGGAFAFTLGRNSVGAKQLKTAAVTEKKLANGAVTNSKIANNSVDTNKVADGSIRVADTSNELRLKCPNGTQYFEAACFETTTRADDDWLAAEADCLDEGRRLPSPEELVNFRLEPGSGVGINDEWTEFKGVDGSATYSISIDSTGVLRLQTITFTKPYRCVAPALR
jgi:hypothetical protein